MGYGASANNSTGKDRPGPGMAWLFSAWPVRERLADI